ncbi:Diaminopimelate epimerase [Corynebacterium urogenitale]|uniref:Diaminopimelate epimerase n=1 Tax=Corynebacterium urogenitale TaxID=2487892 RepID=A0A5J6ZAY5_9CORY|nr:diaminopimelate epimerase [Corynebacterium urogenitale]QFQ02499.1 Diaminopimelate epimerase [Corynebacterium urogenitale]
MDNYAKTGIRFLKGHGTENDFVLLIDPQAEVELTADRVQRIADRRAGIGGDGVIRIATAAALQASGVLSELPAGVQSEEWFMDYRNADGSIAEMCGNGVRVFAHACVTQGFVEVAPGGTFGVGTRGGRKEVTIHECDALFATVSVEMGAPEVLGLSTAQVGGDAVKLAGLAVDMGNPHLASVVPDLTAEKLAQLPIEQAVTWDESFFPHGVNLEVVTPLSAGEVHMRVHERGVGETRSCGTGTVAATVAALADAGRATGTVRVNVPGGQVDVTVSEEGSVLKGPSEIVAEGTHYL